MADIFISYKKEDRDLAESVIRQLEHAGFSVWYDESIDPTQSWDATIEAEINQAKSVVVLWTQRSVKSEWVRNEADFGKEHGKLIPLKMEECEIPLAFRRVQAANLIDWDGSASNREWQKACKWIAASKHKEGSEKAAVPEPGSSAILTGKAKRQLPKFWLMGLLMVTIAIGIAILISQKPPAEPDTPQDPRLVKAKVLFNSARFLVPKHISARGHLESNRSRLCIASEFEAHEWENLFRGLNANDEFRSWSFGFEVGIFKDYLLSGDCLIIGFSDEYKSGVEQLSQEMDREGNDPPYRIVSMSELYEEWELGF